MVSAKTADHENILKFTRELTTANTVLVVERGSIQIGDEIYTSNIGLLADAIIDCGSNNTARRDILEAVYLNRCVGPTSLALTRKKPFDAFVEGPFLKANRGDRI